MKKFTTTMIMMIALGCTQLNSQSIGDVFTGGRVSGNFQIEAQTYSKDSLIGAPDVPEKLLSNGFLNLNYSTGSFNTGLRYESYMNPILGIDPQYKGSGIAYRYANWGNDFIHITVGDFYEQFGSGLIYRSYEERALGLDNATDGFRVKLRPTNSIEMTALIGKQRNFWGKGEGIIRGGDINFDVTDAFELDLPFFIALGGSVISKFQSDRDPFYLLPENVLAYSSRLSLSGMSFLFDAEFGYKYNDPNGTNKLNYNDGYGLLLSGSYFTRGFSFALKAHKIDNMDFRSDRTALGNNLMLSYIPPINKQNAFKLPNMYPYATKLNGEAGIQADVNYVIPAKSALGGQYGTSINVNFSRVHSIDTVHTDLFRYDSDIFAIGDKLFYQDFNISISRKITSKFKSSLTYINLIYDKDILENEGSPRFGKVFGNFIIIDGTYQFDDKNALRFEIQNLFSTQDSTLYVADNINGNWAMLLLEYSYSPNWFISISDEYNYGNKFEELRLHYYTLALTYIHSATRIQLSYGRQKQGIICVGGVCRTVPASNGLYLSITNSF